MTTNIRDPRSIVTPDAFDVSEEMLGLPLAPPSRRAFAILVDLVVIALITAFLSGWGYIVWGVIGLAALQLAFRAPGGSWTKGQLGQVTSWVYRGSLGCLGVLILLVVTLVWFGSSVEFDEEEVQRALEQLSETEAAQIEGLQGVEGVDLPQIAQQLAAAAGETQALDSALLAEAEALEPTGVAEALSTLSGADAPDSVTLSGVAWGAEEWETALRARAVDLFASDTVQGLERTVGRQAGQIESLRGDLAVAREEAESGLFPLLRDIFGQLGSAFGVWTLYFTLATVILRGRTVGKLVARIRVVRLDGEPITWLPSLERAGGYAAGLATGLMGFLRVFWDRNRQCVHDRIVGTVVVLDGVEAIPGSWEEVWTEPPHGEEPES